MFEQDQQQSIFSKILGLIDKIYEEILLFSSETARAIREAHTLLNNPKIDARALASSSFSALFGRGLQYISLERKNTSDNDKY